MTTQLKNPNASFAKFVAIPFVVLMGLVMIIAGGGGSSRNSEPEQTKTAAEAADVGDTVTILYPYSTIMCADRNDMAKVYAVGEMMQRQTYRIENDAYKAVEAAAAGRKQAMASAYSCKWAPKNDVRFTVQEKNTVGDDDSLFHVAAYCLKPVDGTDGKAKCWWIEETASSRNPQIKRVGREPSQQDVDQLKEAGRKLQRDSK